MFQGKRQQYFLKHKGAYTINKSQGETLFGGVAVEITVKYSPWQKGQVVVVFSRSTKSELMVVVGNRQFTKKKLWELITQRTQWCQLMDAILHLVTINNEGDDMPTLDYTTHYPFTISNIPIPREDGGYVYILISVRDTQQIYIGSTGNLAIRFRSHNSGSGSNSTNDHMLRPWALAGYISGLPSDSGILCQYEQKFKEFIDDAKARGVHDVFSWVYRGGDVAALYNSTISEEQGNSARFVITIERGQLNNNRSL
jgi:predicted GIY-YIG superfamily endonuclease